MEKHYIGRSLEDDDKFVCWQFTLMNGKRGDFICTEYGDEKRISDKYISRDLISLDNEDAAEIMG